MLLPITERPPTDKGRKGKKSRHARKASLKLERDSNSRYEAGTPGQKMQFKLSNAMLDRPVSIEEWFARDDENIKIFVAPCEKGASASVRKEDWKQIHPYIVKKGQKNRKHNKSPVTLNPNNAVLLEVDLKFLENYKLGSKPSQNLAVRAELDLLTVEAAADIFEIEIIPSLHAEILSGDEE